MTKQKIDHILKEIIYWLFVGLGVLTPLFFTWSNQELFEFNKMVLVYGGAVLICLVWAIRCLMTGKFIWRKTWLDIPLALFFLSQLVSTIFSIHLPTSLWGYYTRFNGGLMSFVAYTALFYALVSNFEPEDLWRFLKPNFAVICLVGFWAILEHFGHSISCILINGHFDTSCWVQDVQTRVFASFGQPNWLAVFLVSWLGIIVVWLEEIWRNRPHWPRFFNSESGTKIILMIGLGIDLGALIFTKSRSGLLAAGGAGLILLIGWSYQVWRGQIKTYLQILGGVIIICLGGAIFGLNHYYGQKETSLRDSLPTSIAGGTESGEIRQIVWAGAIKTWQRRPLIGSGPETFAYSYYQDRLMAHNLTSEWDYLYNKAHNEFLNYLATTGIFGLGAYVILLGSSVFLSGMIVVKIKNASAKKMTSFSAATIGITAGIGAMSVANFFGFAIVYSNFLLFIFLGALALIWQKTDSALTKKTPTTNMPAASAPRPDRQLTSPLKIISLIALALIASLFLTKIANFWLADYYFTKGESLVENGTLTDISRGLAYIDKAIALTPSQALFYSRKADLYAQLAVSYNQAAKKAQLLLATASGEPNTDDETASQEEFLAQFYTQNTDFYRQMAEKSLQQSLILNSVHLNFYKTGYRVYLNLAQIDPNYLTQAEELLYQAIELAPTDAKLRYNLALLHFSQGKETQGLEELRDLVANFKPDYHEARIYLAQRLIEIGELDEAKANYQYILRYIDPDDLRAQNGLADVEAMMKKSEK